MEHKNIVAGIFIFFTFVMLGGVLGIFVGYSFSEGKVEEPLEVQVENNQEHEILKEELTPIDTSKLYDLQKGLDTWKEIIQRTSQGKITHKEASHLIYAMSSNFYKRNIPEEFCGYRLKNMIGKGPLRALNYSQITYDGENIAYVDVVEIYEENTCRYQLKFVKENDQWCFAAQL